MRIYANPPSQVDEILVSDAQGVVNFTYEYDAVLLCDVSYEGRVSNGNPVQLEQGKTTTKTIVLPQ